MATLLRLRSKPRNWRVPEIITDRLGIVVGLSLSGAGRRRRIMAGFPKRVIRSKSSSIRTLFLPLERCQRFPPTANCILTN